MKKIFVFSICICFLVVFISSKTALAQSVDTESVLSGTIIGGGEGFTTTTIGSSTVLIPPALNLSGPRGIKELNEKVYYTVSPEKPRLGETVNIKAEMYGTPVKNAEFAWVINNKTYERGVGVNKISFSLEKKSLVTLIILTQEGNVITKQWSFNPQNTLIIWEAGTYTPPFYKGKSLYSAESNLALHAINLDVQNPLTNVYANYVWQVDGRVKGEDSGVGKSTYVYKGDLLTQEPLFKVDFSGVSSFNDNLKTTTSKAGVIGSAILRVQTQPSKILTYERTPLLGVLFNKPLVQTYALTTPETTVVAYPAYYSLTSSLNADYTWTINNTIVSRKGNNLTFKKIKSDERSNLGVEIKNKNSLLQSKDISYIIDTSTKQSDSALSGFGK